MFGEDGIDDRLLGRQLAGLGGTLGISFVVVNVEAQDRPVLYRMSNGVLVQRFLEEVLSSPQGLNIPLDAPVTRVRVKNRSAREAKQLRAGEELFDRLMRIPELRAVALVKDEHHAFVAERSEEIRVGCQTSFLPTPVALAVFVESESKLLDSTDDEDRKSVV